ncbi:MAG: DUF2269 domain-containing protein [Chloroflexota bacterium]|nr:DUF2269 domain-containing protein [Chloroflexota bacterium]
MYQWLVFLHIVGVFGFLLAHGVSVGVMFRIRVERDREKIRTLLALSGASMTGFYASILLLLSAGVVAGFVGSWWDTLWIWISLGLFVAILGLMYPLAGRWFRRIANAVAMRPSGAPMASDEEVDSLLRSSRPMLIGVIGYGGLLAILWLMLFKPF